MFDLIIKNVRIVDGSGTPWHRGDVAVKDGRIAEIGALVTNCGENAATAKEIVDGNDMYLAPGFIDIHGHSDTTLPLYPTAESRILQGVTTEIGGNCGMSVSPVSPDPEKKKLLRDYVGDLDYSWNTVGEYLDMLSEQGISINFGTAVGHGPVRIAAMGFDARKPTEGEMNTMKELIVQAMKDGAFSMSSGLIYPPGCYADTEELTELCRELRPFGGFYVTHMRNEGDNVAAALREAMEIAGKAGVPLQVSHHKVTRRSGWRLHCRTTIAMVKEARRRGLDVQLDQYPYTASSTTLDCNLPFWAYEGGIDAMLNRLSDPVTRDRLREEVNASHLGRWGDICVSYVESEKNAWTVGKSIEEIAAARGVDPADACFDLILDERSRVDEINYGMCEDDVEYIMKQPFTMTGSDGNGVPLDYPGQPHPRWFGAFPRVIAWYCRERKLFSLETAVYKMTGLPSARLGLQDRGLIRKGMWADMVLFDFDAIEDTPSYSDPKRPCAGISRVYVNGVLTALNGKHTGAKAGAALKKGV